MWVFEMTFAANAEEQEEEAANIHALVAAALAGKSHEELAATAMSAKPMQAQPPQSPLQQQLQHHRALRDALRDEVSM